ncbi:DUF6483 family protein [Paenibacillus sp. JX-17]|uniref:DUF6483 family protein n=1 Tax=Paenibacillus lacisoli TaxID=3064525 RepID=A0ABT9CG05_9BACL|nr:DUF6483 family protein [Paenibacillus sp. JX-17]MDO7907825.1 DUF6483 family protein [Paenibacillus sp. JX-17]
MLRRDYLVRMIEEMTDVVARVFTLKQDKKHTEALLELDELLRKQFRLNSRLLNSMSAEDIIEWFRLRDGVEVDKVQQVARILEEEGRVLLDQGEQDEGIVRLIKSLHLYIYSDLNGAAREPQQLGDRIRDTLAAVKDYKLPQQTRMLLARFHEEQQKFDEAENLWYRLVRDTPELRSEAVAFYERLLTRNPEELEAGGLPLDEVQEGLNGLLQRGPVE